MKANPCPRCGAAEDASFIVEFHSEPEGYTARLTCNACGHVGPRCEPCESMDVAAREAIQVWNEVELIRH